MEVKENGGTLYCMQSGMAARERTGDEGGSGTVMCCHCCAVAVMDTIVLCRRVPLLLSKDLVASSVNAYWILRCRLVGRFNYPKI